MRTLQLLLHVVFIVLHLRGNSAQPWTDLKEDELQGSLADLGLVDAINASLIVNRRIDAACIMQCDGENPPGSITNCYMNVPGLEGYGLMDCDVKCIDVTQEELDRGNKCLCRALTQNLKQCIRPPKNSANATYD